MKSTRIKLASAAGRLSLLALAIGASSLAMADQSPWYLGANVGQGHSVIDTVRVGNGLLPPGSYINSISVQERDTGYKIFGGYQFSRYIAVEGGYFDLGHFGFNAVTVPPGTLNGEMKVRGINLDLVGTMPLTERLGVFARVGANYAETSDNFSGTGAVTVLNPNPSKRDTNVKVGLGVQYALTDALGLRGEVERYRVNDAVGNKGDVDLVSLGLVYRFGAKTPTPVARAYVPEPAVYVAQAPQPVYVAPAPAPIPAPQPRMLSKVTFSADSLFDFDKSVLKPGGQEQLDKFVADLNGSSFDVITVTGHTDRIGTHAYNMKLSQRRAETVKGYLVGHSSLSAAKIVAKGVDGADPVTAAGSCPGKKVTAALKACLQPDRRVDVEVTALR
jgi:OmpA-OmpF porin, OOP family